MKDNINPQVINIILIFSVIILTTGCARHKMIGTWKFNNDKYGPLQLKFNDDYTYEVDHDADGKKDIWGKYQFFNDRIRMEDEMARVTTECYEAGYYKYKFSNKDLVHFNLVADQCNPRKETLKHCLKRVK